MFSSKGTLHTRTLTLNFDTRTQVFPPEFLWSYTDGFTDARFNSLSVNEKILALLKAL